MIKYCVFPMHWSSQCVCTVKSYELDYVWNIGIDMNVFMKMNMHVWMTICMCVCECKGLVWEPTHWQFSETGTDKLRSKSQ